jgi:spore coat protein CotH
MNIVILSSNIKFVTYNSDKQSKNNIILSTTPLYIKIEKLKYLFVHVVINIYNILQPMETAYNKLCLNVDEKGCTYIEMPCYNNRLFKVYKVPIDHVDHMYVTQMYGHEQAVMFTNAQMHQFDWRRQQESDKTVMFDENYEVHEHDLVNVNSSKFPKLDTIDYLVGFVDTGSAYIGKGTVFLKKGRNNGGNNGRKGMGGANSGR